MCYSWHLCIYHVYIIVVSSFHVFQGLQVRALLLASRSQFALSMSSGKGRTRGRGGQGCGKGSTRVGGGLREHGWGSGGASSSTDFWQASGPELAPKAKARPLGAGARSSRRPMLVARSKARTQPPCEGTVVASSEVSEGSVGSRLRARAAGVHATPVASAARLVGDIPIVAPVLPEDQPFLCQLSWSSILVAVTPDEPEPAWVRSQEDDRGSFQWCTCRLRTRIHGGGWGTHEEEFLRLAFSARVSFVHHIQLRQEGASPCGFFQWAAARIVLVAPQAGMSEITVGAVLIGDTRGMGARAVWQMVAEFMVEHEARVVVLIRCPAGNIYEAARRFLVLTRSALQASTVVEYREARLAASAYGESVQFLVLGRACGFDGALATASAIAEERVAHVRWRRIARTTPQELQGTLDFILPMCIIKYVVQHESGIEGRFASVWLRGDSRRSEEAVARRAERAQRFIALRTRRATRRRQGGRVVDEEDL